MSKTVITMRVCDICGDEMEEPYGYFNFHFAKDHELPIKWLDICEDCYKSCMKQSSKKLSFKNADDYRMFHDWRKVRFDDEDGELKWLR